MNWILGYSGLRHDTHEARVLRDLASQSSVEWKSQGLYVAAAGRVSALKWRRCDPSPSGVEGWIVAGLGMELSDGRLSMLSDKQWDERLSADRPDLTGLDGHFCVVRWRNDGFDFFNDALGLRTLFIDHSNGRTLFSTSLELLARVHGDLLFDFEAIGAQWFGRAELESRTALKGVERLGQGATASIRGGNFRMDVKPFSIVSDSLREVGETLLAVANPSIPNVLVRSLACSGGLDSRVQLAAMLQSSEGLRLHSYGPESHPDVRAAHELSSLTGLPLDRLDDTGYVPSIAETQVHAVSVHAYAPASNVADWMHYDRPEAQGSILLDASLGEAGRCFFYRGLRSAEGARLLRARDATAVARIQRQPRPEVFSSTIQSVMISGHDEAVDWVLSSLPEGDEVDDMADLLMLRLEIPRYAGYAASHVDDLATGYFPFAQPSVLRSMLKLSPGRRRSGGFYRKFIRQIAPQLTNPPLVRNGRWVAACPFDLSGRKAAAWALASRLTGRAWKDDRAARFLRSLEMPIRDLVRSESTRHFEGYDQQALQYLVDGFFDGRHDDSDGLDRWLSFELWRLGLVGIRL